MREKANCSEDDISKINLHAGTHSLYHFVRPKNVPPYVDGHRTDPDNRLYSINSVQNWSRWIIVFSESNGSVRRPCGCTQGLKVAIGENKGRVHDRFRPVGPFDYRFLAGFSRDAATHAVYTLLSELGRPLTTSAVMSCILHSYQLILLLSSARFGFHSLFTPAASRCKQAGFDRPIDRATTYFHVTDASLRGECFSS